MCFIRESLQRGKVEEDETKNRSRGAQGALPQLKKNAYFGSKPVDEEQTATNNIFEDLIEPPPKVSYKAKVQQCVCQGLYSTPPYKRAVTSQPTRGCLHHIFKILKMKTTYNGRQPTMASEFLGGN